MLEITNNVIKITKGDSATLNINLVGNDGLPYTMDPNDILTMTVRKGIGQPVIFQSKTIGSNAIGLTQADTKKLPVGSCVFDIQLDTHDHETFTVIGPDNTMDKNLYVYPEVTE